MTAVWKKKNTEKPWDGKICALKENFYCEIKQTTYDVQKKYVWPWEDADSNGEISHSKTHSTIMATS
jgi:hypothetical protein